MAASSSSQHLAALAPNPIRTRSRTPRRATAANFAPIDEAVALGIGARLARNKVTTLRLVSGRSVRLVPPDGVVTPEGKHYYALRGEWPPSTYAYEQPLIDGKWVLDYNGKKTLVRKFVNGAWQVTRNGADYFKHNQDTFRVEYPVRRAYKEDRARQGYFVYPSEGEYRTGDDGIFGEAIFTVGKLKQRPQPQPRHPGLPELTTDKEQEDEALRAAHAWVASPDRQHLQAYDMSEETPDGVKRRDHHTLSDWVIIWPDSPFIYVYDPISKSEL